MKHKTLTIILGMIFLIGIISATGTITNLSPSLDIPSFIAGDTTSTTFSFDYEDDGFNNPDASLVLRANITSLIEGYPVWKKDFQLSGFIEQYSLLDLFLQKIFPLRCVEDTAEFRVQQGLLYTETNIPAGTFYCYDPDNYLDMLELGRRDKTTLFISSNPALYPGEYGVSVELLEMEPDTYPPIIKLNLEKTLFNEDDIIPIRLNVSDMYNIDYVEYEIINPELSENFYVSGWISANFNSDSGFYEDDFVINEHPDLNTSGTYWIKARACDVLGNCGDL